MEPGFFLLTSSFISLLLSSSLFSYLILQRKNSNSIAEIAESTLYLSLSLSLASLLLLSYYFVTGNFTLSYVYENSDKAMPVIYKLSATWAGKEGSLLLWSVFSLLIASIFTVTSKKDFKSLKASAVLAIASLFILGITISFSNPFATLHFQPSDGVGMNPLLRTIEMIFHPPVVFLGYSLTAVPYALYLAGYKEKAIKWARLSWTSLTLGIVLGCWWAYRTLGWGGFWGWDPVENASLLPWLSLTAYFHARGRIRDILVYIAFLLVIFAAFVTRSGIIKSVHAFTYEFTGWAYFAFLVFFAALAAFKLLKEKEGVFKPEHSSYSKKEKLEKLKFYAVFLFAGSLIAVLIGTIASIFVSVDRIYYNITFTPLFAAIVFLILLYITKMDRMKLIIHLGVILLFIGAIAVWNFESRYENVLLSPQAEVGGFTIKLLNVSVTEDPEKFTILTHLKIESVGEISPKLYLYKIERDQRVVSSVELIYLPWLDYYIALREISNDYSWAVVDFYTVPLISLVWIGSALMLFGTFRFYKR